MKYKLKSLSLVSRKTSWRSIAVLAMVSIILIVSFLLWMANETKKRLDIGYGTTTNANFSRLEIGDKVFSISKNYIWSRGDWKGGKVSGVNLHALLPDFEPLTEVNRHEFEKPGWWRKISMVLSEHAMQANERPTGHVSMTRREIYERTTRNQTARDLNGPFGLRLQKFANKLSTEDDMYVGTKRDGSFYWVTCRLEGKVPFPSCSTYIEYSKHVVVHYTFPKAKLSDWMRIEDGVLDLIKKFENNTNQGEYK